jgi:DNA polymerase III delta subunit
MMAKKKRTPPVMVVSGNHDFLRERRVKMILDRLELAGRSTDRVDGAEKGSVARALAPSFLSVPTQYVVTNPQHVPQDLITAHSKSDSDAVLILHYQGKIRAKSKFETFSNEFPHFTFAEPKKWEADDDAISFIRMEAKRRGYTLSSALAKLVVTRGGNDLGMLSFEVLKATLLAGDEKTFEGSHIRALAYLAKAQMDPIFKALGNRNETKLAEALLKYRAANKVDPTIPLARALGTSALLWICAVSLAEQGVPDGDAAKLMGRNPWHYKNTTLPVAHRWGLEPLQALIRVLAESDRQGLSSVTSPWTGLTCGLLKACRPISS